jgi:DNA ligase (NAD+)
MGADAERLRSIEEIGPETAESVATFFNREENRTVIEQMRSLGVRPQELQRQSATAPLKGLTFVVTGSLERFSRKEVEKKIEELGGRVTSSVSSNTDYLLLGENPGSKLEDAQEEGTHILDEEEFVQMIGEDR